MNDVLAVEELVHEIKENLRLKSRPSSHNHGGRNSRPSPYHIPCRSWNEQQSPSSSHLQIQQQQQQQAMTTTYSGDNSNVNNTTAIVCCGGASNLNNFNNINNNNNKSNNTIIHNYNSNSNCNCKNHYNKRSTTANNNIDDIDDPYELLQALIKKQNLVKEAVRRLQLNISPKQRYFYESDDDGSRSPLFCNRLYQLEL